jgi:hypothetical protein
VISPLKNGDFEMGEKYPSQWEINKVPKESTSYLNESDTNQSFKNERSFRLRLENGEKEYDFLSWSYSERDSLLIYDRPISYNLWFQFAIFGKYLNSDPSFNSIIYVSLDIGRKGDQRFPEISNTLSFYLSQTSLSAEENINFQNNTNQVFIRLDSPSLGNWKTYLLNITDYATRFLPSLENIPAKYLMLKRLTVCLASRLSEPIEVLIDDFRLFSRWTPSEIYDWWKKDIESYSDADFLVIAGIESTIVPHLGAYGLNAWHNFSIYETVEERVRNIKAVKALSVRVHPRSYKPIDQGFELLEIYTADKDQYPSNRVLKLWDDFLSKGSKIYGVAGLDNHKSIKSVIEHPIFENLVIAEYLNKESIISALRHGKSYIIRSDTSLKISFSAGLGGPQQGGGEVYTSPNSGVTLTIQLENIPPDSELSVIQNGTIIQVMNLERAKSSQELHFPLENKSNYYRLEIRQNGKLIGLSNPLFFSQAKLPIGVWAAIDPTISSSSVNLVQGEDDQIEVQLFGTTGSISIVKIHLPEHPREVFLENLDFSETPSSNTKALIPQEHGWTFNQNTNFLTAKITLHGLGTILVAFGGAESKNLPVFLYAILGSTILLGIYLSYYLFNRIKI